MLVGGDLGFSYLVLVVVILLFAPVISFVVCRKWRHATARREEIKRLLILAAEEAARAELEDTVSYSFVSPPVTAPSPVHAAPVSSVPSKPPYQCAVCFCPTTTRCSKCKAVRYCSGKCQIIHWRQGHKDECRDFVNIPNNDEVGGRSGPKTFRQDINDNYTDNYENEEVQRAKSAERYSENPVRSRSSHLESLHQKENTVGNVYPLNVKSGDSTIKFSLRSSYKGSSASSVCSESSVDASASTSSGSDSSGGFFSSDLPPDEIGTTTFSDCSFSVNSVDSFIGSGNQNKPYFHGSSEPDRSTSGSFWEGTIHSRKSRSDMADDGGRFSSLNATDESITNSQSTLSYSFDRARRDIPSLIVESSKVSSVKSYVAVPNTLGIKEPKDEKATFSKEPHEDGMKGVSPSTIPEMSRHMVMNIDADSRILNSKDAKHAPSGVTSSRSVSTIGGHLTKEDAKALGSLPSSSPDRSNRVSDNDNSSSSCTSRSLEVCTCLSKASETCSSSCTRRRMAPSVKSVKVGEGIHEIPACSLQLREKQGCRNELKTSMFKDDDQHKASKLSRHYPPGLRSVVAGGYGSKGLFPYELFVKLFNSKKVDPLPCGLINCGNSCYANAVLQCLAFTPPLTAYLVQGLHSNSCEKEEWCFTCEFESLVRKAKDGYSPLSPIRILSQLKNIGSHLGNGREEDAHEFLRCAIDTMQSVCLREAKANTSGLAEEETTLIGLTFGGYLRSKIKCMRCRVKSERQERMMDLTVEIEGDIRTLEEALNNFTGTEILDGDNKYQCSRCKSFEKAKKKLSVLEAPNVLTIALKRFQSGKFGKLDKPIEFPEILDMAPYMSGTSDKSPIYQLYGVVVHIDIMNAAFSGHYVCYVKNVQNKWFKIDDSTVKEVELHSVLTKGAYMLLYARCSPRAPRLIRNSLIPLPRKQKNTSSRSRSHSRESWDFSRTDHVNDDHLSSPPFHRNIDEEPLSDHSSSIFSGARSCSSESSNRDSSSTDDYFDQIFGDVDRDWNNNNIWRHTSDSDTSSSSSPSPLYMRQRSPLSDSNRYASSGHEETRSGPQYDSGVDGNWSRFRSRSSKDEMRSSSCFLGTDEDCRKLGSSSSCKVTTNSDRLGRGGWADLRGRSD